MTSESSSKILDPGKGFPDDDTRSEQPEGKQGQPPNIIEKPRLSAFKDFMLWFFDKKGLFFEAISEKNADVVKLALTSEPQLVLIRNDEHPNETPLHVAARKATPRIVRLLLSSGADIHAKTIDGWTPLHKAAFCGNFEIVRLLVRNGAALNTVDDLGETPYDKALNRGNTQTADFLAGCVKES